MCACGSELQIGTWPSCELQIGSSSLGRLRETQRHRGLLTVPDSTIGGAEERDPCLLAINHCVDDVVVAQADPLA